MQVVSRQSHQGAAVCHVRASDGLISRNPATAPPPSGSRRRDESRVGAASDHKRECRKTNADANIVEASDPLPCADLREQVCAAIERKTYSPFQIQGATCAPKVVRAKTKPRRSGAPRSMSKLLPLSRSRHGCAPAENRRSEPCRSRVLKKMQRPTFLAKQ